MHWSLSHFSFLSSALRKTPNLYLVCVCVCFIMSKSDYFNVPLLSLSTSLIPAVITCFRVTQLPLLSKRLPQRVASF